MKLIGSPRTIVPTICLPAICLLASADEPVASSEYHASDEYLDEYGTLYDHLGMLSDNERMRAYYDAIHLNSEVHFKGKVVLDVGTGTGVLAIWAAQAGARRVYAVEGTSVAKHAETMAKAHGFGDIVRVLRGKMEDVQLPEQVDVIVSEWMGYFLLRENMIQSVIFARDRWMRPGGVMYPSSARLLLASLHDRKFVAARDAESEEAMRTWDDSSEEMLSKYGLDFSALRQQYEEEHHKYTYRQAWQGRVPAESVAEDEVELLQIDMHTVTSAQLFDWEREISLPKVVNAEGVVGYFDVRFCGHEGSAATECVELSTSPHVPATHWGQTALLLDPAPTSGAVRVTLQQSRRSHHDLNFTVWYDDDVHASYSISNDFRGYAEVELGESEAAHGDEADEPLDAGAGHAEELDA